MGDGGRGGERHGNREKRGKRDWVAEIGKREETTRERDGENESDGGRLRREKRE